MSSGWSLYVIAIVALNIIGAMWLLIYTSRKRPGEDVKGETTGHTWDGDLVELNNPMPRWWLRPVLWARTVFAVDLPRACTRATAIWKGRSAGRRSASTKPK